MIDFTENTIFAAVSLGYQISELHFFELDESNAVGSLDNERRSYLAFRRRMQSHVAKKVARGFENYLDPDVVQGLPNYFKSVKTNWVEVDQILLSEYGDKPHIPHYHHKSLKDFYRALRYDQKRKRLLLLTEDFK